MTRLISIALFLMVATASSLIAGPAYTRIYSKQSRADFLHYIEQLISEDGLRHRSSIAVDNSNSPFGFRSLQEDTFEDEEIEEQPQVIVEKKKEPLLTDNLTILELISKSIKPSGTIQAKAGFALLFGQHIINDGDSIQANYKGIAYTVHFDEITDDTYTLRLKDATVERNLDDMVFNTDPDTQMANNQ